MKGEKKSKVKTSLLHIKIKAYGMTVDSISLHSPRIPRPFCHARATETVLPRWSSVKVRVKGPVERISMLRRRLMWPGRAGCDGRFLRAKSEIVLFQSTRPRTGDNSFFRCLFHIRSKFQSTPAYGRQLLYNRALSLQSLFQSTPAYGRQRLADGVRLRVKRVSIHARVRATTQWKAPLA